MNHKFKLNFNWKSGAEKNYLKDTDSCVFKAIATEVLFCVSAALSDGVDFIDVSESAIAAVREVVEAVPITVSGGNLGEDVVKVGFIVAVVGVIACVV